MEGNYRFEGNLRICYDNEGRTYYTAPVEMEEEADLIRYGADRGQVRRLCSGKRFILIPIENKAVSDEMWRMVHSEHSRAYNLNRCMIIGKRGRLIRCDDRHSCAKCPFGRSEWEREPIYISWDEEHAKNGFDPADERTDLQQEAEDRIALEELKEGMDRKDPRIMRAMELRYLYGKSVREIAEEFGVSTSMVYHLMKEAERFGKEYREE